MKAIILTTQRTGSTFLAQCLDSHPQVWCRGEILIGGLYPRDEVPALFDRLRSTRRVWRYVMSGAWRPASFLDSFYTRGEASVMAFKVMYNHLRDPRTRRYLVAHPEIRVIHLLRENLLKQYVSKALARKRFGEQPWGSKLPVPTSSVRIVPAEAVEAMNRAQVASRECEMLFSRHPRIDLLYETMIDGSGLSDATATAITDFLELEPAPMVGKAVKVSPDKLERIVENYDELAAALHDTEFARFLD